MHINHLEHILRLKRKEVARLEEKAEMNSNHSLNQILKQTREPKSHFSKALKGQHLNVIAEVKRRSPSCGEIRQINDPAALALEYCRGGAAAISVLTDEQSFGGSLGDLREVTSVLAVQYPQVAVLRKDFILHPLQLAEAVLEGAHAVLLIAHAVADLKSLIQEAKRLGLETLTEVHDRAGLELALEAEAPIIGINHRNLETFQVDLSISEKLRPLVPNHVVVVAESGIHLPDQAKRMRTLGFDAILVGEALVRSDNPSKLIREMRNES